jgi:hypothetical protein
MHNAFRALFPRKLGHPERRSQRRGARQIETLESRQVLDGGPVITEFMANNNSILTDEDGDFSDWIEIYNDSDAAVNLANWRLTDNDGDLDRWTFPSVELLPGDFLTVFASNKDRDTAGQELHTNFGLSANGEFLALVRPDDTIASSVIFPQQIPNVSFGLNMSVETSPLFDHGATGAYHVPNPGGVLPANWTSPTFNEVGWQGQGGTLPGPFGYDTGLSESLSPQAATLALNPLGYWRMSETAGVSVANLGSIGVSANGAVAGAANLNVAGPRPSAFPGFETDNSAMNFDGANDALDVGGGGFMSNLGAFSVMGWVRPASFTATRVGLFGQNDAIEFGFIDPNTIQIWTPGGGSVNVAYGFPRNEWHHIAAVGDGSGLRVYFDGNLTGSVSAATNNYGTSSSGFRIGGNGVFDTTGNFFTGDIDEVAAFNFPLTQAQIQNVVRSATLAAGAPGGTVDYTPLIGTDIEAQMHTVSATALVRVPFTVTGSADFDSLTLKMRYDDGFVAYLNGVEVARRNAPASPAVNSAATALHEDAQAVVDEEIDISDFADAVQLGSNVLAIHALNASASNTDFLISPALEGARIASVGTEYRYFTASTPEAPNGIGTADLGPIVTGASHTPNEPLQSEPIVVTAAVFPSFSEVSAVQLWYRVMYDAEVMLPMVDDGSAGDDVAFDGTYAAIIPGNIAAPGQMIRWRVTTTDEAGNNSRWPLFADPLNSEEYLGTVVQDPSIASDLPVFHWFLPPGQQGAADSDAGARSALFYNGEFYDNVRFDLHGQSTRSFPEKSYDIDFNSEHRFRLSDDLPLMKDINILSNYGDKTKLRNTLAYETFRESGSSYHLAFPIRVQQNGVFYSVADFVEDGDDVFLERLGRNPEGALYKMYNRFDSASGEKKTRRDEGNADLQAFYTGVHQANTTVRTNFLWDNVNMPAMISYMAGTMIASNYDCCHKNYYLYRDVPVSEGGTGEWEMMPWDVDLSWGRGWSAQVGYLHNQMTPDFPLYQGEADINDQPLNIEVSKRNDLLQPLFNTPGVRDMYLRRVRTLMDQLIQPASTPLDQRVAEQRIDELVALIGADGLLDDAKWGTWQANGNWAQQIAMLKNDYLGPRRDYLYNTLSTILPAPQPAGAMVTIGQIEFAPASGNQDQEFVEILNPNSYAIDISEWTLAGDVDYTFKAGTVIPAGGKLYVTPDSAAFRARTTGPRGGQGLFVQGGVAGHLSSFGGTLTVTNTQGVDVATTTFPGNPSLVQQFLRITELMYHPSDPTEDELSEGFFDDNFFEYVELTNTSTTQTLDLTGVRFTEGIAFDFTGSAVTSLAPGGRVVVVRDAAGFAARYGEDAGPVAGVFTGSLDNSGERIKYDDAQNGTVLEFEYSDVWYPLADGAGFSIIARDPLQERDLWETRHGWMPSYTASGSPGEADPSVAPLPGSVVINELIHYGTGPQGDRIELYNPSSSPINVSGWYLSNDELRLERYQLPALPAIQPGGYLVLDESTLWDGVFDLSAAGGTILLQAASGGELIGYQTRQDFGGSDANKSFGPHTKSTGDVDFVELLAPTIGAANTAPRVGPVVINEIMYNPAVGDDEFLELKNISASAVNLNGWSLSDGVEFLFGNTTIVSGGYLIVSSNDPTQFRTKYAIPLGVEIVGPFTGALSNTDDNVLLNRPGDELASVQIDRVNYGDLAPWPTRPDGGGSSLARAVDSDFGNDPANWVSDVPGGTPGAENGFFDDSAPTTPTGLSASILSNTSIALAWNPAVDLQSGIGEYLVYRDGSLIGTSATTSFVDGTAVSGVAYSYQVAAANPSQVSSGRSSTVASAIVGLVGASTLSSTSIRLNFDGALSAASANVAANYFVSGATVTAAALQAGGTTVLLTTSPLVDGQGYRVAASDLENTFGQPQLDDQQATFIAGTAPGLLAQYFNDPNSTDPATKLQPANLVLTRVDPSIAFNFGTASPAAGVVNTERFSVRWTGKIETLDASGPYRFDVISNDGVRIWVDDLTTPLIDRFLLNTQFANATITLQANTKYDIKVEYFDNITSANITLRWTPAGGSFAVIPASQFSQVATTETTRPVVEEIFVAGSQWSSAYIDELAAEGLGSQGVNVPVGGTTATLPWSNMNQIKVRFDSDVLATAASLAVNGVSVADYGVVDFDYDYTTFTGTWTLAEPLAVDRATIGLVGLTDIVGNSLVGVPTTTIRSAPGDIGGDATINASDRTAMFASVMTNIGHAKYSLRNDVNGDGYINAHDFVLLQQRFGQSLPGPSAAASAVVVARAPDGAAPARAEPLAARRAIRAATIRREAVDRALTAEPPSTTGSSNPSMALRARRVARAAILTDAAFDSRIS